MSNSLAVDRQYKKWIVELKGKKGAAQIKAAMTVNRQLLELYWELGRDIYEKQQKANWGEGLIEQLARDLSTAFPGMKGYTRTNIFYIKKWYEFYRESAIVQQAVGQIGSSEIVQQVVAQIPWGHNILIINRCADVSEALFYVRKTIDNNWSRAILMTQLESRLYQRSGKTINNFSSVLPGPQADAEYRVLRAVPDDLKGELPSIEELERELGASVEV